MSVQIWVMRTYHSPEPIILSVGEEDEISIADVARAVAGMFMLLHILYMIMYYTMISLSLLCPAFSLYFTLIFFCYINFESALSMPYRHYSVILHFTHAANY